ncbi:MAG: LCP family protein [Clostridiales bacterium]|nr:LCP family protein [Clostridiales bacterium]
MNHNSDDYEDEIDRIRIRSKEKKKHKHVAEKSAVSTNTENIEFSDIFDEDLNNHHMPAREGRSKERGNAKKKKKNGIKIKKRFLLLVLLITAGILICSQFRSDGWWTVAVFGLDSRDGNLKKGALSDVEMLCSVNKKSGEIRLLSVFRDTYLRIDEDDYDKINEAYFLGGPEQALNALEMNFDLSVDDYAAFNWKAVVDALNILGGVDIEISDSEFAYINSFITETVESTGVGSYQLEHSGQNHLDGVQAVAYARLRLMDTDFQRTERQRKILGLAMEKIRQADTATLTTLAGTVFPQISTSIGVDDILQLAKNAKKYYISETSGFPFSHEEIYIGKKSCVVATTLQSNVIQLHEFLYGDTDYTPSVTVSEISSTISEISGLSEPGKDQESGKNIGAQGNTGEQQTTQTTVSQTEVTQNAEEDHENSESAANTAQEETNTGQSSFTDESAAKEDDRKESEENESSESDSESQVDGAASTQATETLESEIPTPKAPTAIPESTPEPESSDSGFGPDSGSTTAVTGQEHPIPETSSGQNGPSQNDNRSIANDSANAWLKAPGESGQSDILQSGEISPGVSP